jgi:serine/threonine-protein phosphatase PGAM5
MGTRTLLLVRHGEYTPVDGGKLTAIGREQAKLTGRWIAGQGVRVDVVWSSTLPRARETADILAKNLAGLRARIRRTGVLREGMYSKLPGFDVTERESEADRARADRAWAQFFRASRRDRLEVVVCHGNLIRWFVCRALRVPGARWIRMNSAYASMTRIVVRPTGTIRVVSYNETAHLPPDLVS